MAHNGKSGHGEHTEEFRQKASTLKSDVQDLGRIGREIAEDSYENMKDQMKDMYQQRKQQAQSLEADLEKKIQASPLKSLLIAAGVGFVIGAIWKSK